MDQKIIDDMEAAANDAAKELPMTGTAEDLAKWIAKWYLKAGYKRLCRLALHAYGLSK
jgi:hypothetical protein